MHRLLIIVFAVLALVGCTGSSQPPASKPRDQHLITGVLSDPKTFNPLLVVDQSSAATANQVFDGLLRFNPVTGQMEGMLAESWDYRDGGTVCTLHLRHDVRWHDGTPFTAADVAFTFDAIFDDRVPNSTKHTLLIDGERIKTEVVDDFTVRLVLPRPFAPLLSSLGVWILPKHILGATLQQGTFTQAWGIDTPPEKIIGTGPYRIGRYVPSQFVELQRNPDYWMKDEGGTRLPYLQVQTDLIVPNQDTLYLKFLSGQTDLHIPRPEEVADLRDKSNALHIAVQEVGLETGSTFVSFNRNPRHYVTDGKRDPRLTWFTDPHFLHAIEHAIDKQAMIVNCLNGYGKPAVSDISPESKLFFNPNLTDIPYDLEAARRELEAGGYTDRDGDGVIEDAHGNPIEFSLHTNAGNQVREKMCSILKEDWSKLGMKVNYRPLEFTTLVEKLDHTFDWDAILIGFTGTPEPNNGANLWRSSGNLHLWNPSQTEPATPWEAEIDHLLDQGSGELDVEKRRHFYWRIQEILHDQSAMIETVRQTRFAAAKTVVQNFRPTVWDLYRPELLRIAEN